MTFKEQQDELLVSYLNRTFFRSWRMSPDERREPGKTSYENYSALELDVNPICDLACKYCYLNKYGKELAPPATWRRDDILKGTEAILDWLKKNKMLPKFDIFSGDPFVQRVGYEVLELIYAWYGESNPPGTATVIPTNMSFLFDDKKAADVENLIDRYAAKGVSLCLSASVDGMHMEENRPIKDHRKKRDDAYYGRLFEFAKKHRVGFHPMVYSEGIEKWPRNFLWFMEMFEKYGIPWHSALYLLEVRNKNWTKKQCEDLEVFMYFLVKWVWEKVGSDMGKFVDFVLRKKGFNTMGSSLITHGRGIGCSIQSSFQMRLGDLKFFPCHRTSYGFMESGQFMRNDKNEIVGIESINPELLITIESLNISALPMCSICQIGRLCGGGCLGSQYEATGDMFSPIPTTCRMEFHKLRGLYRGYKDVGALPAILSLVAAEKAEAITNCFKEGIFK